MLTAPIIEGFVGSLLLKRFDQPAPIPDVHREWWDICCGQHKYVALAAPRGFAKSTAITHSYVLANVLFRERSFVIIVSGTETQSILFLNDIKNELIENEDLIKLFGIKPSKEWPKDAESDIIVEMSDGHQFRIIAKGSEQKLRGVKWRNKRPDLVVCDDMEEDEQVMSKDRREKFRKWFFAALMPCLSDNGIIRIVGTILHMDSLLERLMPEFQLQTRTKRRYLVQEPLKLYTTLNVPWKSVKYRAHDDTFENLLWPEKKPEQVLRDIRTTYVEQGNPEGYAQEYLNIPLDESTAYFRKSDFKPMVEGDREKRFNYYITADLAISEKDRADWSVFVVGGVDENGMLHIKNVIRARMDSLEIMETIFALEKLYSPIVFGLESGQISKAIGPFLYDEMPKRNIWPNLYELKPSTDKWNRARSISARMRAGGVKFDKDSDWYQILEDELIRFPRDKHDDQVDGMAYLGLILNQLIEAPTKEELDLDIYNDEYRASGLLDAGRSATTGY